MPTPGKITGLPGKRNKVSLSLGQRRLHRVRRFPFSTDPDSLHKNISFRRIETELAMMHFPERFCKLFVSRFFYHQRRIGTSVSHIQVSLDFEGKVSFPF